MLLLELVEEMQIVGCNRSLDLRARRQAQIGIDARDPDFTRSEPHGEQLLVTKLLGHHDGAVEDDLTVVYRRSQPNMLRTHADADRPPDAREPRSGKRRAGRLNCHPWQANAKWSPFALTSTVTKFIEGEPMKLATKRLAGLR